MEDNNIKQLIRDEIKVYFASSGFTDRKLTDTPTDANMLVPRKYVTLNGATANRPKSSVVGQPYLDMTLASGAGKPVWWNGTGFIDATGNYV